MTQENKELLLKYLCMVLPYGVKVKYKELNLGIEHVNIYNEVCLEYPYNTYTVDIEEVKPYLRSMSSMTEEERTEYLNACGNEMDNALSSPRYNGIDWLLKNHFDFMDLIPKDLAIEAPKGMYFIPLDVEK